MRKQRFTAERTMTYHIAPRFNFGRRLLLTALAAPVAFGLMNATGHAQSQPSTAEPAPTFEVASIKPNHTGSRGVSIMNPPGGRFVATNIALKMLIRVAYKVQDFQITGGPGWINSERFDIEAKAENSPAVDILKLTEDQRDALQERQRLRLQALLADRFQLKLHRDTKDLPVYALVVAKNGPKLHEAAPISSAVATPNPQGPKGPAFKGRGMRMTRGQLSGQEVTLQFLTDALSSQLGRTVIDRTGLKGSYDFTLQWTPDESQSQMFRGPGPGGPESPDSPPPPESSGPSIFTAVQEQLGLKLDSAKGPVEILVIDHVEQPSAN